MENIKHYPETVAYLTDSQLDSIAPVNKSEVKAFFDKYRTDLVRLHIKPTNKYV